MANPIGQPLAEALVKVKLVYDSADVKRQATTAAVAQGKALKDQITTLRKEAMAFSQIAGGLNKAAGVLFKTIVGPAMLLGGLGIRKYMQSTEKGAAQLRGSFDQLKKSWDQFLGRVGRVIFNSGILTKVIEKLKSILDGLDDKKIGQLFSVAKWAAILYVFMKISAQMALWVSAIKKMTTGFIYLKSIGWFSAFSGAAGSGAVAAGAGKKMAGAEIAGYAGGGVAGGAGGFFGIKELTRAIKQWNFGIDKLGEKLLGTGIKLSTWDKTKIAFNTLPTAFRAGAQGLKANTADASLKPLMPLMKTVEKLGSSFATLSKISSFIFRWLILPLEAIAGILKGVGFKVTTGGNLLWTSIKFLWKVIQSVGVYLDYLMSIFRGGFEALGVLWINTWGNMGNYMVNLLKTLFTEGIVGLFQKLPSMIWEILQNMATGLGKIKVTDKGVEWGNIWTPLDPRGEKKLNFMEKQKPQTTSFAGLQQVAQEMAWETEKLNVEKANTQATEENTQATSDLSKQLTGLFGMFMGNKDTVVNSLQTFQSGPLPYSSGGIRCL